MQPSEVYIVVPLSRPHNLRATLDNYLRQTFLRKHLVIVENGPALGACEDQGVIPDLLTTCEHDVGTARNTGVEAVKQRDGYVVFFDDDDYYGPEYVRELVEHAREGRIVGKSNSFAQLRDRSFCYLTPEAEMAPVAAVGGPTLSFWAREAVEFREGERWGEDMDWVRKMREKGAEAFATSRHHFLYIRHGIRQTLNLLDHQLLKAWGFPVYRLGEVDLDVVNGLKDQPQGTLITPEQLNEKRESAHA